MLVSLLDLLIVYWNKFAVLFLGKIAYVTVPGNFKIWDPCLFWTTCTCLLQLHKWITSCIPSNPSIFNQKGSQAHACTMKMKNYDEKAQLASAELTLLCTMTWPRRALESLSCSCFAFFEDLKDLELISNAEIVRNLREVHVVQLFTSMYRKPSSPLMNTL